ncbi:hypothetical protein, partial [Alistipes finegoldii]|uniref:hypothetical protein n=1 Tax=Alistipes finegoldii TaxID=214856 RepID=UPI003AF02C41
TDFRTAIISQFFLFAEQPSDPDRQKTCEKRRSTLRALYPAFPRKLCLPPFSHAKNSLQDRPFGLRRSKMRRALVFSRRFLYICRKAK